MLRLKYDRAVKRRLPFVSSFFHTELWGRAPCYRRPAPPWERTLVSVRIMDKVSLVSPYLGNSTSPAGLTSRSTFQMTTWMSAGRRQGTHEIRGDGAISTNERGHE